MICNIHVFLPPVVTGNYISKKSKISILSHHITCFAGWSFVIMLLGLLTALSYSDLVKSWRGECGGIGIRL